MAGLDNISRIANITSKQKERDRVNHAPSGSNVLAALEAKAEAARQAQQRYGTGAAIGSAFLKDPMAALQFQNQLNQNVQQADLDRATWEADMRKKQATAGAISDPLLAALYKSDPQVAAKLLEEKQKAAYKLSQASHEAQLKNQELSTKEKELRAAGLTPGTPDYLNAVLGDNSMDLFAKKELLKSTFRTQEDEDKFERDMQKMIAEKDLDLTARKDAAKYEHALKNNLETYALEEAKTESTALRKKYKEDIEKAQDVAATSDRIMRLIEDTPGASLTTLSENYAKLKENFGFSDKESRNVVRIMADLRKYILPIAKTLGANPSNYDAKVIAESFGGGLGKGAIVPQVILARAIADITKEDKAVIDQYKGDPIAMVQAEEELEATRDKRRIQMVYDYARNMNDASAQEYADLMLEEDPSLDQGYSQSQGTPEAPQGPTDVFDDEINSLIDQYS